MAGPVHHQHTKLRFDSLFSRKFFLLGKKKNGLMHQTRMERMFAMIFWACLVAHATQKSLHSTCHIESYGICMEY
jgi:hypothetical protein